MVRIELDKNGLLCYKGEYLNGKRNWKGKEYMNEDGTYIFYQRVKELQYMSAYLNIKFEGEYLNGKRWNEKGFDYKGNIIYELKNGNYYAKDYIIENLIEFEGFYLNGEKNRKGKKYLNGKLKFEGE